MEEEDTMEVTKEEHWPGTGPRTSGLSKTRRRSRESNGSGTSNVLRF